MKYVIIALFLMLSSCTKKNETHFSSRAYNETFISLEGEKVDFKEIMNQYKGKKVLIDVWATWCSDCIKGMPKVVALQKEFPDTVFLFLSIDESLTELKRGIKKYNVQGEHYLLPSGWDGNFGEFLDLSWIPRYLVIDEKGEILVFNEVKADHENILAALKREV